MCPTPHDYRIAGYVDRCDDYRGFNPHYRAGSVFGELFGGCSTAVDIYTNAGNYGVTTPVVLVNRDPNPDMFRGSPSNILPPMPGNDSMIAPPQLNGTGRVPFDTLDRPIGVPSMQELLDRQRSTLPGARPVLPPAIPSTVPSTMPPAIPSTMPASPFERVPGDSIPFSPSDAAPVPSNGEMITPPSTVPRFLDTDLPITLEELQRLDPSVQDMQIISIEDAAIDVRVK